MALITSARNGALNSLTLSTISLHSTNPTEAGTAGEISGGGYTRQACTFGTASNGSRTLTGQVTFSVAAGTTVSHYVIRDGAGNPVDVGAFTTPELFSNPGNFTISSIAINLNVA